MIYYAIEQNPDRTLRLGEIEDGERLVVYRAASEWDVIHDMTRRGCDSVEVHPVRESGKAVDVDLVKTCDHRGKPFSLSETADIVCRCGAVR